MTSWVLLLRAVNLGSRNKLAMADLRALLTDLGHGGVRTFLNSGNATFTSSKRSAKGLATEVEQALATQLGLSVRVCVRTADEIAAAVEGVPPDLRRHQPWLGMPEKLVVGVGQTDAGCDRDTVPAPVTGVRHVVAECRERAERERAVGALGLLQRDDVRLHLLEPGQQPRQPRTYRVDIPRCDSHLK